ncbi:hypothetical protein [Microbacterium natoriense]|uniref:hypothetical protein n=1 Tax=Microbacterium natoriense TaxID=284570 RepID=UPI0031CE1F66
MFGIYTHPVTDVTGEPSSYTFTKSVSDARLSGAMFAVQGVNLARPVMGQATNWSSVGMTNTITGYSLDTSEQGLEILAYATEIVSPNASEPTATPASQVALVPSAAGTTTTRTVIWVGSRAITSAGGDASLTWTSSAGSAATAVTLRGFPDPVTATGSVALSGTASRQVGVSRAATGGVALSGTAQRALGVSGSATGGLALSGVGDATVQMSRAAEGPLSLAGTATFTIQVQATATGIITLNGTGTVLKHVNFPSNATLTPVAVTNTLTEVPYSRTLEDA